MNRKITTVLRAAVVAAAFATCAVAQIKPALPEPGWAPPGSPVAVHGQLKAGTSGGKGAILDKNGSGSPVVLRGMSLFWSSAGGSGRSYYTEPVIGWLVHDWKVSVVRPAIAAYNEHGGGGGEGGYAEQPTQTLEAARAVIEACIQRGIYVLVDWHTHNGTGTITSNTYYNRATPPSGLNNKSVKSYAIEFFGIIAKEYGAYPNVLFEVYNEPCNDGSGKACQSESWGTIKSYAEDIRAEIRKYSNNLIVVGSPGFSSDPNAANNSRVSDPAGNIAYTVHFYAAGHPNDGNIGQSMRSAVNNGLPVFASEWGTVNWDGDGAMNQNESDKWISDMETNKVSWANWSVSHFNETASALTAAGNSGGPWSLSPSGTYVKGQITSRNTSSVYSHFGKTSFNITATQPTAGGTINRTPSGNNALAYNTEYSFTAVPQDGWDFVGWAGDATGFATTLSGKVLGVDISVSGTFYNGGLIKNGHFTNNATSWSRAVTGGAATSTTAIQIENGQGMLNVTTAAAVDNVRIQQSVSLVANTNYKLTFDARTGSGTRNMPVVVGSVADASFSLTNTMKTFELDFCSPSTGNQSLQFQIGDQTGAVYFDNVNLVSTGTGQCNTSAFTAARVVPKMSWSVSRGNGGITLRGPSESGAKVMLYDVRGKVVRNMAAKDGMTINAKNTPAGNYILVVRNAAGKEVLRDKITMTR